MAGTKHGGIKAAITNKQKHGADFYKRIGHLGGSHNNRSGGFASSKVGKDGLTGQQRAKIAGAKGGRNGRRRSIKEIQEAAKANAKLNTILEDL